MDRGGNRGRGRGRGRGHDGGGREGATKFTTMNAAAAAADAHEGHQQRRSHSRRRHRRPRPVPAAAAGAAGAASFLLAPLCYNVRLSMCSTPLHTPHRSRDRLFDLHSTPLSYRAVSYVYTHTGPHSAAWSHPLLVGRLPGWRKAAATSPGPHVLFVGFRPAIASTSTGTTSRRATICSRTNTKAATFPSVSAAGRSGVSNRLLASRHSTLVYNITSSDRSMSSQLYIQTHTHTHTHTYTHTHTHTHKQRHGRGVCAPRTQGPVHGSSSSTTATTSTASSSDTEEQPGLAVCRSLIVIVVVASAASGCPVQKAAVAAAAAAKAAGAAAAGGGAGRCSKTKRAGLALRAPPRNSAASITATAAVARAGAGRGGRCLSCLAFLSPAHCHGTTAFT
jgi:hypothetical protein